MVGDKTLDQILENNDSSARMLSNMRKPWIDNEYGRLSSQVRQYVAKLENQIVDLQLRKKVLLIAAQDTEIIKNFSKYIYIGHSIIFFRHYLLNQPFHNCNGLRQSEIYGPL